MKPRFSEFTYGYTLVEELSQNKSFTSVPIFPSLVEEGKTGGYDAGIQIDGIPIFLQFKRSEYFSRSNSKYYNLFKSPYYRFYLHALRHSQQHNLLLHLERSGNPVYYVAPSFHTTQELHDFYFTQQIISNSIWIEPTTIGNLPDNEEHSICFSPSKSNIYFCSEPIVLTEKHNRSSHSIEEAILRKRETKNHSKYHRSTWPELYSQLTYILNQHNSNFRKNEMDFISNFLSRNNTKDIVQQTVGLARALFDCEILVLKV